MLPVTGCPPRFGSNKSPATRRPTRSVASSLPTRVFLDSRTPAGPPDARRNLNAYTSSGSRVEPHSARTLQRRSSQQLSLRGAERGQQFEQHLAHGQFLSATKHPQRGRRRVELSYCILLPPLLTSSSSSILKMLTSRCHPPSCTLSLREALRAETSFLQYGH